MSHCAASPNLRSNALPSSKHMITAILAALTFVLIYVQWRSWHTFDWRTFLTATSDLRGLDLAVAVALSLLTFPLRAWRWQIFLRPVRETRFADVLSPTLIGFTGLALLGRPGELVRPYMIARRTNLTMASQMGVWTVERIFDMVAFAAMAAVGILVTRNLPDLRQFRLAAWITAWIIVASAVGAAIVCRTRKALFRRVDRYASRYPVLIAILRKLEAFSEGLNTIKDVKSFVGLSVLSVAIWVLTAFSYVATLHAYPALRTMSLSNAMLLMGFSMVGGLVQLPAVGGGAQLATIVAMVHLLHLPRELAVSAGILLWLVSFHAVTPIGLVLARKAHVSLRGAPQATEEDETVNYPAGIADELVELGSTD